MSAQAMTMYGKKKKQGKNPAHIPVTHIQVQIAQPSLQHA